MQLVPRSPTLLVYLVGLVLAFVLWRRFPRPCLLVALAMSLALLVNIVSAFLFVYITTVMIDGLNHQQVGFMLSANSITATILHGVAIAMLLAAVFVGRRQYT